MKISPFVLASSFAIGLAFAQSGAGTSAACAVPFIITALYIGGPILFIVGLILTLFSLGPNDKGRMKTGIALLIFGIVFFLLAFILPYILASVFNMPVVTAGCGF